MLSHRVKAVLLGPEHREISTEGMSLQEVELLLIPKGKNVGKTFGWVWENDPNYVVWASGHLQAKGPWKAFLEFIEKKTIEAEKKGKGMSSKKHHERHPGKAEKAVSSGDEEWSSVDQHEKMKPDPVQEEIMIRVNQLTEMVQMLAQRLQNMEAVNVSQMGYPGGGQ